MKDTKFIFVTGGVLSALGKGLAAASIAALLESRGLRVTNQKLDPYINVDPGTMSPFQHGEVFVTDDGTETDLDLGHYERFIDESLNVNSNLTTGKVYWNVITKERKGEYLGQTVQVIPHITDEIKAGIFRAADSSDAQVVIVEVGGTVGDIESQPFLESIRQIARDIGPQNSVFIHVTLVPYVPGSDEYKSKPTQHSVKELLSIGIQPDILICRCDEAMEAGMRHKIAMFCNVAEEAVIDNTTVKSLYEVPLMLEMNGLAGIVCKKLSLPCGEPDLSDWRKMVNTIHTSTRTVKIGLVGKYVKLHDAYLSVAEALFHGGIANGLRVQIDWVGSETITDETAAGILGGYDGIIVPGGFGDRGIEGIICAIRYARESRKPFFGICLGMQLAVVEFARNVLGLADANSGEFSDTTKNAVIDILEEQKNISDKGGTMRLGLYPCVIADATTLSTVYGERTIHERHRHRYEFNNAYRQAFIDNGMTLCGVSPDGMLVEAIELDGHPWYVAVQYHPEFKSRPNRAHPLFRAFIAAAGKTSS